MDALFWGRCSIAVCIDGCLASLFHLQEVELLRMAVSSQCRGLGFGRLLVSAAIEFAKKKGYSQIVLGTSHKQRSARRLYEKCGFQSDRSFFVFHYGIPFYIYRYSYSIADDGIDS